MVSAEDVDHRIAVGYYIAVELPRPAQLVLKQKIVGAGRLAVDPVVSAHHRSRLALGDGGAERGKIGVFHVVLGNLDVDAVTRRLRAAVHGEMFRSRDHPVILRVVTLQSGDESHSHAAGKVRIFAVGFLAASPARVAEDVDIRRPEVEPFHDVAASGFDRLIMLGARFGTDDDRHLVNQRLIEGGAQARPAPEKLSPCRRWRRRAGPHSTSHTPELAAGEWLGPG